MPHEPGHDTYPCCVWDGGFHTPAGCLGSVRRYMCLDVVNAQECERIAFVIGTHPFFAAGPKNSKCRFPGEVPGPDSGGCWQCNFECDFFGELGTGCCYESEPIFIRGTNLPPAEQWTRTINPFGTFKNCIDCCSQPPDFSDPDNIILPCRHISPCVPPETPPSCIEAPEDELPPGGREWTIEGDVVAAMGMAPLPEDGGEVRLETGHLLRAEEVDRADPDPCVHLQGRDVMLPDGLVYTEVCTQPDANPDSRMTAYAAMMTLEGDPRIEDGRQYDVGMVRLPGWTEAIYRSREKICIPPPK